tara:strand:+ start:80 stop:895 length:816 start_codon:yes stop_codon:yes gene_type:complete
MKNKKMYNLFLVSLVVLVYLLVTLGLYIFQRSLLYHPVENNYYGDKLTVNIEKVKITTDDNIDLLAWYHKKDIKKYKTILYFHGNAGSLENRIHKINHFKDMNINFILLAWRGFSGNKGKPTEQGLYQDARSAVKWLINQGVTEENIIIYGESLGTGVATEIAQNKNFAGVILESPFTSMIDLGKKYYPIFPVKLLLKDKYESEKKIKNLKSPLLVMHGKKDKIVPFYMGEKIFDMANNPKFNYFTEMDDHMMNYDENLINEIDLFIRTLN